MLDFVFPLFSWYNSDGQPKVVDFQARHKSILCNINKIVIMYIFKWTLCWYYESIFINKGYHSIIPGQDKATKTSLKRRTQKITTEFLLSQTYNLVMRGLIRVTSEVDLTATKKTFFWPLMVRMSCSKW